MGGDGCWWGTDEDGGNGGSGFVWVSFFSVFRESFSLFPPLSIGFSFLLSPPLLCVMLWIVIHGRKTFRVGLLLGVWRRLIGDGSCLQGMVRLMGCDFVEGAQPTFGEKGGRIAGDGEVWVFG